jgi:hypothetical protein
MLLAQQYQGFASPYKGFVACRSITSIGIAARAAKMWVE